MAAWKYYVYQFFLGGRCVYVGKGSGRRFKTQQRRFREYVGYIVACFKEEQDALNYENGLIKQIAPRLNKALVPDIPEPWKVKLIPETDKEFFAWCGVLGTKQMAARVLLSRDWDYMKRYGADIKALLSKLDPWCEVLNGRTC